MATISPTGLTYSRNTKDPLQSKIIWETLAEAKTYVNNPDETAYIGMTFSVINDEISGNNGLWYVEKIGTKENGIAKNDCILKKVGSGENSGSVSWENIENRPFYWNTSLLDESEITVTDSETLFQCNQGVGLVSIAYGDSTFDLDFVTEPPKNPDEISGELNKTHKVFVLDSSTELHADYYYTGEPGVGPEITLCLTGIDSAYITEANFVIHQYSVDVKQLDLKFIPDTIARKSDLNGLGKGEVPDWNAIEGEPGYIKNKTHSCYKELPLEYIGDLSDETDITTQVTWNISDANTILALIFDAPFRNEFGYDDGYGQGDLQAFLPIVKGNSIVKRYDGSNDDGLTDPFFASIEISDVQTTEYDDTNIELTAEIKINTNDVGYGIPVRNVLPSVYVGRVIPLAEGYIPNTIMRKSDLDVISDEELDAMFPIK